MSDIASNIVVDVGNTRIKVGKFQDSKLVQDWEFENIDDVKTLLEANPTAALMLCSVATDLKDLTENLKHTKKYILDHSTPIPFENHYKSKHTLGLDRIAVMAGMNEISYNKNNLVIDIGTCITYDLLNSSNAYYGGSISPGINMRFEAMYHFTEKLPLIENYEESKLVGNTTAESMTSGVINGIAAEMDGIIGRYKTKHSDLKVFVCAGDLIIIVMV